MAIRYVQWRDAGGAGTSWTSPHKFLKDALAVAVPGDEIWVAPAIKGVSGNHNLVTGTPYRLLTPNHIGPTDTIHVHRVTPVGTVDAVKNYITDVYGLGDLIANETEADVRMLVAATTDSLLFRGRVRYHGLFFFSNAALSLSDFAAPDEKDHVEFQECALVLAFRSSGDLNLKYTQKNRFNKCLILQEGNQAFESSIQVSGANDFEFADCKFSDGSTGSWSSTGMIKGGNLNFGFRGRFIDCEFELDSGQQMVDTAGLDGPSDDDVGTISWIDFDNCRFPDAFNLVGSNSIDPLQVRIRANNCRASILTDLNLANTRWGANSPNTSTYLTANHGGRAQSITVATAADCNPEEPHHVIALHAWVLAGTYVVTVEMLENYSTALNEHTAWIDVLYFAGATDISRALADTNHNKQALSYDLLELGDIADWTTNLSNYRAVKMSETIVMAKPGFITAQVFIGESSFGNFVHVNSRLGVV